MIRFELGTVVVILNLFARSYSAYPLFLCLCLWLHVYGLQITMPQPNGFNKLYRLEGKVALITGDERFLLVWLLNAASILLPISYYLSLG